MLNEFVPTRYEARRLTDLSQLIVEELLNEKHHASSIFIA